MATYNERPRQVPMPSIPLIARRNVEMRSLIRKRKSHREKKSSQASLSSKPPTISCERHEAEALTCRREVEKGKKKKTEVKSSAECPLPLGSVYWGAVAHVKATE